MANEGILISSMGNGLLRFVTHLDVGSDDKIKAAIAACSNVYAEMKMHSVGGKR